MASKKHYIITSVTLGLIAASSAALIGVANLITKDRIAQNEQNKITSGINEIFGNNSKIADESLVDGDYKYVNYIYTVHNESDQKVGYAFRTTGSNMYGKISLIVGFNETSHNFEGLSIVTNEQTYATTLVDNYITPLNDGKRELEDVSCGATYGAKLVRDMVNEANEAAKEMWKA